MQIHFEFFDIPLGFSIDNVKYFQLNYILNWKLLWLFMLWYLVIVKVVLGALYTSNHLMHFSPQNSS